MRLRNVTYEYPSADGLRVAGIRGANLDVSSGEAVALVGPSGSGKSTLLHVVGAMLPATDGTICIDDVIVSSLSRRRLSQYRANIGFVFQDAQLLPALSTLDNVVAPVTPYRTGYDKHDRAIELLRMVGAQHLAAGRPMEMSGGERQRVAIARALMHAPRLLLADEPTARLDRAAATEITQLLLALRDALPITVVVATHDVEVAALCRRIVRLRDGHVIDDVSASRPTDNMATRPGA